MLIRAGPEAQGAEAGLLLVVEVLGLHILQLMFKRIQFLNCLSRVLLLVPRELLENGARRATHSIAR